ncbi:MAG: NADP-dependent oxidoreductase [Anaerolineae bacterium]
MAMMKAVRIHSFGGPEVLQYEDAPLPDVQPGTVLVKVHAAGVNPVDAKTRMGRGTAGRYTNPFPLILGWDIAGTVEAAADDVNDFKVGDAVYGMVNFPQIGAAYAEYVVSPATHLALKPATIDFVQAAALPLAALTAWQALFDTVALQAGERVLIHAAAGGVGHLAVQLAKWKGAYVAGTASAANADFLRGLGVDEVIDYTKAPFETQISNMDVVMDCVGGDIGKRSLDILKVGGRLVSIAGSAQADLLAARGMSGANILVHTDGDQLRQIAALVDSGKLTVTVGGVYPLERVGDAHEQQMSSHTRGKLVLKTVLEA